MEISAREQKMKRSAMRLRIFVWIFFPFLGVVCGEVFGMGLLLGIGLGVGISFMLDGTLRLMSSDTKIFRVRRDLEER
jgi:hypothetical protein